METVTTDDPALLTIAGGLKPHVAPLGNPEHESVTEPLNPKVGSTVRVEVAELPAVTLPGDKGLAESSKPGGVVLSSTPIPLTALVLQKKTRSGRPSLFMSPTRNGGGR